MTNFSRIIEYDKPEETIYQGPQAILTITLEPIRAFFLGSKRLLKTQNFEKKSNLSSEKKKLWPIFSPVIECHKPQQTFCKDPKGILTITVEPMRAFF